MQGAFRDAYCTALYAQKLICLTTIQSCNTLVHTGRTQGSFDMQALMLIGEYCSWPKVRLADWIPVGQRSQSQKRMWPVLDLVLAE